MKKQDYLLLGGVAILAALLITEREEIVPKAESIVKKIGTDFGNILKFTLKYEGGKSNHPADRGGKTNMGIIQTVYNAYRKSKGLPQKDVYNITKDEVQDIYYSRYWVPSHANELPPKTAMVHFDVAVNSGVGRAVKMIRQAIKADEISTKWHPAIITKVNKIGDKAVAKRYVELREKFYRSIVANNSSQSVFLKGWLSRNNALKKEIA